MTPDNPWAARALQHAQYLAERIGPRGSATPEEKRAADYAQLQMQALGLQDVRVESFRAPRSAWLPLAIVFSIAVWGSVICWAGFYITHIKAIGALIGAALGLFGVWTVYCELTFKDHVLRRRLPTGLSHNAIGRIPARDQVKQRVVLIGHLDTHPTAWIFQTPRRARLFRLLLTLSGLSLLATVALLILGGFGWWGWAFTVAGLCGFIQSAGILMSTQADQGDFSAGANDNASGIGTVLALSGRLRQSPLKHTEVWAVCSGSKEVGCAGLRAFLDRYGDQLRAAWFIAFEGVGIGERLIYLTHEGPLRRSILPMALRLVQRAAQARPDLSPQPRTATDRSTCLGPISWRGLKGACISVYRTGRDGLPNWRSRDDVARHLQVAAFSKMHEFGWEILQQIDGD